MVEHKVNEEFDSLKYAYGLVKGRYGIGDFDVNDIKGTKTHSGNTALHIAARYGINELVKRIAESDMELFSENSNKDKAYHIASREGHISTPQMLLAVYAQHFHNKGLNEQLCCAMLTDSNKRGNTIFHEALMYGGQKGAAIFEALGSSVTINDREGAVKLFSLLESDVNGEEVALSENNEGKSPLCLVIEFGYKPIFERLLKICRGNRKRKSPLHAAIVSRD